MDSHSLIKGSPGAAARRSGCQIPGLIGDKYKNLNDWLKIRFVTIWEKTFFSLDDMKGEEREREEEIYLSNSQTLDVLEAERLVGEGRDIHTEGPDAQLQHHRLLVAGEVAHVLEYEVLGPVVLAVGQVGRHEAVLELRVLAVVEPVHAGEALAGRPAAQQVHLAPQGDHLPALVGLHAVDRVGQQQVAVVTEHGAVGVVQFEGLGGRLEDLDGPLALGDSGLVEAGREAAAAGEDVEAGEALGREGRQRRQPPAPPAPPRPLRPPGGRDGSWRGGNWYLHIFQSIQDLYKS